MEQFNQFTVYKSDVIKQLDWLKGIVSKLNDVGIDSVDVLQKIENAIVNVNDDTLRIALLGAFSDGKTSVIAGWLGQVMNNMIIDSNESSNELAIYKPDNLPEKCEIVDTPGLFGDKERLDDRGNTIQYSDITRKYISEAHLIFYVVDAVNPLKESHKDTVQWVLRDLNKLSSTIFIINKMDEVADLRDEDEFEERSKIKKDNLLGKLDRFIQLTDQEKKALNIVCIASNPNGRGLDFWLEKKELYGERSRINKLKAVTNQILSSTARDSLIRKTGLDVVRDVILENLTLAEQQYNGIDLYIKDTADNIQTITYDLEQVGRKFSATKQNLLSELQAAENDVLGYLNTLSVETLGSFIESQIGGSGNDTGSKLKQQIENICLRHLSYTTGIMKNVGSKIEHQLSISEDYANSLEKMTLKFSTSALNRVAKLPTGTIKVGVIAARDAISGLTGASLKFKPWGATNLAGGIAKWAGVAGVALSLYSMWNEHAQRQKAEQEFPVIRGQLKDLIQGHFSAVYERLSDDQTALVNFAPEYIQYRDILEMQKQELENLKKNKQILEQVSRDFKSVQQQGLILDTTFREV
ncbi:LeoA/HP0731 family dynamin-like GTPase [Acinetobacter entericus]|uniref:Dynamin family protein n=1 Tax=Acinetobacter entericus TaxID=2989714 RepID=A0ABT3NMD3_9GAMM|nr:LeoA/HP0731 family dynamin-like GTPase [Acinetobacter entericus]MCW8040080.1 dynamin family protein [Acinetobacter entericus]